MASRGGAPLTFVELRARAGITQSEIAAHLELPSHVHYSHLEIGQSSLTVDTAHQLADLLGVPVTDIAAAYATARRHRQQAGVYVPPLTNQHIPLPDEPPARAASPQSS